MGGVVQKLKIKTAVYLRCLKEIKNDKQHRLDRSSFDAELIGLSKEIARNGYVIIKSYYDREKCDELCAEIDNIIDKHPDKIWVDDEKSDHRFFGINKVSEKIHAYFSDPFLMKMCECYLGARSVNNFTLGARLETRENNIGSGGGWHRDSEFEKQFKSIIYLSDVGIENGPFQILEKTNSTANVVKLSGIDVMKRYTEENINYLISEKKLSLKTITAEKGDLILVDTRSIHRGMPIEKGVRYAMTNYFCTLNRVSDFDGYFQDVLKV